MAFWDKIAARGDIEDRRGMGGFGLQGLSGAGLIGVLAVVAVNFLLGGQVDLSQVLSQLNSLPTTNVSQPAEFAGEDDYEVFASRVLGSANTVWSQIFTDGGQRYTPPKLVLFRQATSSGCGFASSEVGPHYCPSDQTIYLDETFFSELTNRFGAEGGDVAEAYVIAHEVGHHVQQQLGVLQRSQSSNEDSIKTELQADCFAGIWAYSLRDSGVFEQGEINEAIDAAAAVGDDRIQSAVEGRVNPETWTHGSSDQRKFWFGVGYETGSPARCNTF